MDCWKKSYSSQKHASKALRKIAKKGYILLPTTYVYRCPACQMWHIGHDRYHFHSTKKAGKMAWGGER